MTSKKGSGGARYLPMVFTEHGILQLSHVLRSKRARLMIIRITEIFIKMREMLTDNLNVKLELEEIKKVLSKNSKNIELVFNYLDKLIDKKDNDKPRNKIGYKADRNSNFLTLTKEYIPHKVLPYKKRGGHKITA